MILLNIALSFINNNKSYHDPFDYIAPTRNQYGALLLPCELPQSDALSPSCAPPLICGARGRQTKTLNLNPRPLQSSFNQHADGKRRQNKKTYKPLSA